MLIFLSPVGQCEMFPLCQGYLFNDSQFCLLRWSQIFRQNMFVLQPRQGQLRVCSLRTEMEDPLKNQLMYFPLNYLTKHSSTHIFVSNFNVILPTTKNKEQNKNVKALMELTE